MADVIAELSRAPFWVQVTLAALAVSAVGFLIVPAVQRRRSAQQFAALARASGHDTPGLEAFTMEVAGRVFEIRHQHRSGAAASGTMRGPRGTLLITTTTLASPRWELHGVDIARGARLRRALGHALIHTGDESFDRAFAVSEDGVPVRARWLDQPTRQAVVDFFEHPLARGTLWIQEGRLSHLLGTPWTGVDAITLRTLVEKQATLAEAFDRTAR